jgi:hypothetical protein
MNTSTSKLLEEIHELNCLEWEWARTPIGEFSNLDIDRIRSFKASRLKELKQLTEKGVAS